MQSYHDNQAITNMPARLHKVYNEFQYYQGILIVNLCCSISGTKSHLKDSKGLSWLEAQMLE